MELPADGTVDVSLQETRSPTHQCFCISLPTKESAGKSGPPWADVGYSGYPWPHYRQGQVGIPTVRRWLAWGWEGFGSAPGLSVEFSTRELSHLLPGPGPGQPKPDLWGPRKSQLLSL